MNLRELKALIQDGESERLEFKLSTGQRTEAVKTACAMFNGPGGFVIFGLSDKGEIVEQQVSAKTLNDIVHELSRIEPPAFPDIETVALPGNKSVIVLKISGGGAPYTYDGRPYARHGSTTQRMPQQRYEKMLLERMHARHRWENQPAQGFTLKDLDLSEITLTVEEAIRRQRMEEPGTRNTQKLLIGLGLIENGQLLNAAVVLFGKSNRLLPGYAQCLLKMARFRGADKSEFIDNRQEYGNALDLFQRAQSFCTRSCAGRRKDTTNVFERIDDPLYPPAALREALANALCHRDYSFGGGAVSLAIYDDRLEISNTGDLHFGLTPEMLTKTHPSRPWNPLIAQTFYRRGIIEIWGRGTNKIIELTEQAGLPAPQFECQAGEVLVRFRPERTRILARQAESGVESVHQRVLYMLQNQDLTKSEIAHQSGKKAVSGSLNRSINNMLWEGLIERTIPDKPKSRLQRYRLTARGKSWIERKNMKR